MTALELAAALLVADSSLLPNLAESEPEKCWCGKTLVDGRCPDYGLVQR